MSRRAVTLWPSMRTSRSLIHRLALQLGDDVESQLRRFVPLLCCVVRYSAGREVSTSELHSGTGTFLGLRHGGGGGGRGKPSAVRRTASVTPSVAALSFPDTD